MYFTDIYNRVVKMYGERQAVSSVKERVRHVFKAFKANNLVLAMCQHIVYARVS